MLRSRLLTAALLVAGMICVDLAPAFAMSPVMPIAPGVDVGYDLAQYGPPRGDWGRPRYRRPPPAPYWGRPVYRRPPPGPLWGAPVYRPPIYRPPVYRPPVGNWSRHVNWCMSRYRSYDPRSDTYQPYGGPRQRCISPFRR